MLSPKNQYSIDAGAQYFVPLIENKTVILEITEDYPCSHPQRIQVKRIEGSNAEHRCRGSIF